MNRKNIPEIRTIEKLNLIHPEKITLSNGIPLVVIDAGTESVCRIDFVFEAGSRYQEKLFQASLTNQMIPEGIKGLTGGEIAEQFEFYGSFFNVSADRDEADLTIHTLEKYLEPLLSLTRKVLFDANFPEEELKIIKANRIQSMRVDEQRVESQARKHFNQAAFGASHPYGVIGEPADLSLVSSQDLSDFHRVAYGPRNCRILATGPNPATYIPLLEKFFGSGWDEAGDQGGLAVSGIPPVNPAGKREIQVPMDGAVQTAIRIGCPLFGRTHPDFQDLTISNTILGGYFGSRLMNNIRENKGYTYGISSHVAALRDTGFFVIGATVGAGVWEDAIVECNHEMTMLGEQLISESELIRVKNYLIGQLQRSIDGPFQLAEQYRPLWMNYLDFNYLTDFMHRVNHITAVEIRSLSRKYFQPESMITVAAGPIES